MIRATSPSQGSGSVDTAGDFVQAFIEESHRLHEQLHANISGLSEDALNWKPPGETNSMATLIIHTLGSEADVLRIVRGMPTDRNRDAEFDGNVRRAKELVEQIHEADALLDELAPGISGENLFIERIRPSAVRTKTPKKGIFWLLNSYGHTREHLGHLELTSQLYRSAR
jgi:DinB superfamily